MHLPVFVLALCVTRYEALIPKQIPEDESQKSFRKNDFPENVIFRLTTRGNYPLASSLNKGIPVKPWVVTFQTTVTPECATALIGVPSLFQ